MSYFRVQNSGVPGMSEFDNDCEGIIFLGTCEGLVRVSIEQIHSVRCNIFVVIANASYRA